MSTPTNPLPNVSFHISNREDKLIKQIVDRIMRLWPDTDRTTASMDIIATHANGCPLDLIKMLNAPDEDLHHDCAGIAQHIDRKTGKLDPTFLPRCHKHLIIES